MEVESEIQIKIEYLESFDEDPLSDNPHSSQNSLFGGDNIEDVPEFEETTRPTTPVDSKTLDSIILEKDNKSTFNRQHSIWPSSDPVLKPREIKLEPSNLKPEPRNLELKSIKPEPEAWSLPKSVDSKVQRSDGISWYRDIDSDGKLYCKFCNLSYSIIQTLRYHVRLKHPQEAAVLREKIAKMSRSQKLTCHVCYERYPTVDSLREHVSAKHTQNTERYLCEYCLVMFNVKNDLRKHIKLQHSSERDEPRKTTDKKKDAGGGFVCPYCPHVAKRKYALKTHMKARHKSESDEAYSCPFCPYESPIKYYLQNHVTTRHPNSDYARSKTTHFCDVCGYTTPRKSHFLHHRKAHFSAEKKHKCEFCDYSTDLASNLEVHRRVHTKEKPFSCDFEGCNYKCSAKTALNSHKLKHDPAKYAIYCDKCNYKTVYKHALKKHRHSHDIRKS